MSTLHRLAACLMTAVFAATAAAPTSADEKEVYNFHLTAQRTRAYILAARKLRVLSASDPALRALLNQAGPESTITAIERKIERSPKAVAAIRAQHLTVREFVVLPMTLIRAAIAVGVEDQFHKPIEATYATAANKQFVRDNRDEVAELTGSGDGGHP